MRVAGAVAALLLTAAAPPPAPVVVEWPREAQPIVRVAIKDATLPVRIALAFDSAMLLNLGPATAAKLKAIPFFGKATVKNALIPGGSVVARFNMYSVGLAGTPRHNVPTAWLDKPIAADADGVVSLPVVRGRPRRAPTRRTCGSARP